MLALILIMSIVAAAFAVGIFFILLETAWKRTEWFNKPKTYCYFVAGNWDCRPEKMFHIRCTQVDSSLTEEKLYFRLLDLCHTVMNKEYVVDKDAIHITSIINLSTLNR